MMLTFLCCSIPYNIRHIDQLLFVKDQYKYKKFVKRYNIL